MRRLRRLLIAACLMIGLAGPAAGPVMADDPAAGPVVADALELSLDGEHWSERAITEPLFDPDIRWVPGDVRTETFYVRNTMPDDGALRVTVERRAREALIDTGWLRLSARAGDGAWTRIDGSGRHVLVDNDRLAGSSAVPVRVRAAFDSAAPNGTMVLASDLDFKVVLADATAVLDEGGSTDDADDDDGPGGISAGPLPSTGSEIRPWYTPLGLLLIAAGAVLVVRRRRSEPDDALADLEERRISACG